MNTNTKHWASITAGILSLAGYASAASLGSEKYTYDASGNIVEKSIDGQVTKMNYDSSNRLTERQATGQSKETTAYDAAGRPIAMKDGTDQATRGMSYGYGDKVVETKNDGTNTGFYYNAEGQLVGKKTNSGVATYTWDGNVLAADASETYTNEAHITGGIPAISGDQTVVVSDYLGNTLSQGCRNLLGNAYGEGLEEGRFTGKLYVKELENYVFAHRNYDPQTSRWTVADPTGFPDGLNNFAYVNGNPLLRIDPFGTDEETAVSYYSVDIPDQTGATVKITNDLAKIDAKIQYKTISTFHKPPTKAEDVRITITGGPYPTDYEYNSPTATWVHTLVDDPDREEAPVEGNCGKYKDRYENIECHHDFIFKTPTSNPTVVIGNKKQGDPTGWAVEQ